MDDKSRAWLEAIEVSSMCLQQGQQQQNNIEDRTSQSMRYLSELERLLRKRQASWKLSPRKFPPPMPQWDGEASSNHRHPAQEAAPVLLTPELLRGNPFACISQDDDDSEEESSSEDEEIADSAHPPRKHMSQSRLLIRVLTTQGEIFCMLASISQRGQLWNQAAGQCAEAFDKIHGALVLADSEIARRQDESQEGRSTTVLAHREEELSSDASIVHVASQHLASHADRIQQQMNSHRNRLLRALQPQWASRDEIKQRMGDRWYTNPAPKHDYAAQRREDERRLRDVEKALSTLQGLDVAGLQASSLELCGKLDRSSNSQEAATHGQRYNGLRPTDYSRRVSWQLYPDPAEFGWRFTGSEGNRVEFFEKDDVKLDWCCTTGTMKTCLEHPRQGPRQMFREGQHVSPEMYIQILLDPRTHTGVGYQTRETRNNRAAGRGRGRSSRGRGTRGRGDRNRN